MIAGWSMLRQRYLHLSVNVLKELKFSDVETEKILKTVNNSSAEELTNRYKHAVSLPAKLCSRTMGFCFVYLDLLSVQQGPENWNLNVNVQVKM